MGTQRSVNIMLPSDISELFRSEGLHPRRMTLQPWATHRETRSHGKGVFLKSVSSRARAHARHARLISMLLVIRIISPQLEINISSDNLINVRYALQHPGFLRRCQEIAVLFVEGKKAVFALPPLPSGWVLSATLSPR